MFTRVLYTVATASGVVAVPEVTLARAGVGGFTGALAWRRTQHFPAGDDPATAATGQPASRPHRRRSHDPGCLVVPGLVTLATDSDPRPLPRCRLTGALGPLPGISPTTSDEGATR